MHRHALELFLNKNRSILSNQTCKPCEGGVLPLTRTECEELLSALTDWQLNPECDTITCDFTFKNYYHTMAFVNAVAWLAHKTGHHPDLSVSYNTCKVSYSTHAIQGLSQNDFICAAKASEIYGHA